MEMSDVVVHSKPEGLPIEAALELDPSSTEGSTFRIQNLMVHLTYASHFDPQTYMNWMEINKIKVLQYSIVCETGATGHKHTHVLLKFTKMLSTKNAKYFDYPDTVNTVLHPNINKVKGKVHWDRTVVYHCKQVDPFTNIVPDVSVDKSAKEDIKAIWAHSNVSEAILNACKSVKEVGGVIAAFNCKPIDYGEEPTVQWKPWQQELYTEMMAAPNDRTVAWYWDPHGNAGKSFYAKHMGMYKGTFVTTKANAYHVATQIQDVLKQGASILSVIFNFTRQTECHKVYQAIESLKDGLITSEKYHSQTLYFPSPHVVIFANYFPDISQMTSDRWSIRIIENAGMNVKVRYTGTQLEEWIQMWTTDNGVTREDALVYLDGYIRKNL